MNFFLRVEKSAATVRAMERINPLAAWLDKHDKRPYLFAREIGVGMDTIYRAVQDTNATMPSTDTMLKIEQGTAGEVTIRHMIEHFKSLQQRKS